MNSMIEETGKDPNLETNKMEEIEKLTSARIVAETSRDEALKEVETLKRSEERRVGKECRSKSGKKKKKEKHEH